MASRSSAIRSQRLPRCARCGLPPNLCLCGELPRLEVRTKVLVVMHRREPTRSSNSARLALAMLPAADRVVVGARDRAPLGPQLPMGRRLLLFPLEGAAELSAAHAGGDALLLVPDGTWPQARRLAKRIAAATDAQLVRLPEGPASRYGLRRNVRPGTVSTFEAIARALALVESSAVEAAMLPWLDEFVRRTLRLRGRSGPIGAGDPMSGHDAGTVAGPAHSVGTGREIASRQME